ncbi:quinolinate synthase NadA [Rhodoplanes sp. TEM]|uniref:Quinolinate synthase n=1 Tax=Rhodoplanes tepidamans TaxID=200616 RepID=A0ABT5J778_RHOTP|nr:MULTISPECIES: quinolinate synthase NadA [Rhodoplanes]MDC7785500.1 quinolinate synthase NadA [Rhodoplanes tepidamans]MDC7986155.1 quinolinate synthase NadA [Rhodoplanes sp. TEM]MDQ0353330.1 quinolinate synthase [Rhodoplanes tepidamans]
MSSDVPDAGRSAATSSPAGPGGAVPDFTPEIAEATRPAYERLRRVIPAVEWPVHAPLIHAIDRLKRERRAIVLAHNYQAPEIFHGVADLVGDSLALARQACDTDAEVIVLAGVHFMAETAKLMNPDKTVLIPDPEAGCSLAASIAPADVRRLRERHPGVPVVAYVNTSVAVKAEVDICCTSGNALEVVESLGAPEVIMLPDAYLARHVASRTAVRIIAWEGQCEVHVRFTAADIAEFREAYDELVVLAHPECTPEVLAGADLVGSTAAMIDFIESRRPPRVLLLTECAMSDNVTAAVPEVEIVRPCHLCPHMGRITLANILAALRGLAPRVEIDPALAAPARRAVERMLAVRPAVRRPAVP